MILNFKKTSLNKLIWNLAFLLLLSLPNLIALSFNLSITKLAAVLIPIMFFIGLSRLVKLSPRKLLLAAIPFFILSYMDLSYLLQYNVQTSAGVIDAIIETNPRESLEFIKEIPKVLIFFLIIYIIGFSFLFFTANKLFKYKNKYNKVITFLFILLPIIDLLGVGSSARSFPLGMSRAVYLYTQDSIISNRLLKQREAFHFNAKIADKKNKENYIFVIGETSRRDYYSLYGYARDTNPKLSKQDALIIFTDVIAPANATIPSLKSMLYMATAEDDSLFYTSKSIISLAKEAQYKTYWLSSQARFGRYDSTTGSTGVAADKTVFINQRKSIFPIYDQELLPLLKKGLDDTDKQKFIILHLYGSHLAYNRRYPKEYNIFKGIPPGYENHTKDIQNKINEYSNSIAYTDFILKQTIEITAAKKEPSCVVYTSDHGEYLAESADASFTGHGYPIPYKSEIDVPFLVWCSPEYREQYPKKWQSIIANRHKKISNENVFYALADLLQIDFPLMKPERSFFNPAYQAKPQRKVRSTLGGLYNYRDLK